MKADYILTSNIIFTAKTDDPFDGFIAIKDNMIISVGTREEMQLWIGENTEILEYRDKVIMPGFCDSHIHAFFGAMQIDTINLIDAVSEEDAAKRLYELYKDREDNWVIGFGWFHYFWKDKKLPSKHSLDKYFPDRPVIVFNDEMHSAWVNSKALELCCITRDTPNPAGGEIEKDTMGEPTGYLLEAAAMKLVTDMAFDISADKEAKIIEGFFHKAAELGVTSVSDIQILDILKYQAYESLEKKGKLTARIHFAPSLKKDIKNLIRLKQKYNTEKLKFSGVKEFIDGTPMAHTGLLIEPYNDIPDFYGHTVIDECYLREKVKKLDKENIRIRIHACGDGAVRLALDIFEEAQKENGKKDMRHTIEHIENIHPDDLPRFKELGVIASVQPDHLWVEKYEEHPFHYILGAERNELAWAFKSLMNNGAQMAFGTDFPISELNPLLGVYRAVTRLHEDKKPPGGWIPKEKLTVVEALKHYTISSAYQMFRENDLGTLESGKLADIVVLDKNIFEVNHEEIRETKVILTMMDGKIIYQKNK